MQFLRNITGGSKPKAKPAKPQQLPPTGIVEQPGPPRTEVEAATARVREQDELEILEAERRYLTELQQEHFVASAHLHFEEVELEAASSKLETLTEQDEVPLSTTNDHLASAEALRARMHDELQQEHSLTDFMRQQLDDEEKHACLRCTEELNGINTASLASSKSATQALADKRELQEEITTRSFTSQQLKEECGHLREELQRMRDEAEEPIFLTGRHKGTQEQHELEARLHEVLQLGAQTEIWERKEKQLRTELREAELAQLSHATAQLQQAQMRSDSPDRGALVAPPREVKDGTIAVSDARTAAHTAQSQSPERLWWSTARHGSSDELGWSMTDQPPALSALEKGIRSRQAYLSERRRPGSGAVPDGHVEKQGPGKRVVYPATTPLLGTETDAAVQANRRLREELHGMEEEQSNTQEEPTAEAVPTSASQFAIAKCSPEVDLTVQASEARLRKALQRQVQDSQDLLAAMQENMARKSQRRPKPSKKGASSTAKAAKNIDSVPLMAGDERG